jgi:hypothetical protein
MLDSSLLPLKCMWTLPNKPNNKVPSSKPSPIELTNRPVVPSRFPFILVSLAGHRGGQIAQIQWSQYPSVSPFASMS